MPYLVLARKYRPQTFADLVGQEHVTRTLTNAIKLKRIAHGYLFTGTRGVGKTTVARIFAKALNCESAPGPTPEPCGKCASCREIAASISNDVFEIDAASNTGVDDIRELRENVKYLPSRGRYKIYIIDEVHMLSRSAFNALLKTLEEPPPHVVFIFATTEPHKIPDTVLSRTQQYEFKMVSLHAIREYLGKLMKAEEAAVPNDVLALVARKAAGSVRDALSYMDQVLSYGPDRPLTEIADVLGVVDRQTLLDLSAAALAGDPVAVLDVLERLGATNWDVKDLLADLLEHFRNLVAAKLAKVPGALIDAGDAELAALVKQVEPVQPEMLEHLFLLLAESEELILRSGQPRLVLEMTLVRLAGAAKTKSLDELLDQLIALKEGLISGNPPSTPPVSRGEPRGTAKTGGGPSANAAAPEEDYPEASAPAAEPEAPAEDLDPFTNPRGALAAALRPKRRSLAALLLSSQVLRDGDRVILQAPRGFSHTQFTRDLAAVVEAAKEVFGASAEVVLEESAVKVEASPRARMEAQMAEDERRRAIQRESLEHPAVQWTKEMFPEAEVNVRPLKPAEMKEE